MKKKWFEYYGFVEWLKPEDYYAGPWTYVCSEDDDCEETFDIVRNTKTMEMRYTTI